MTPKTDIVICFRSTEQYRTENYLDGCVNSIVKNTRNFRLIFLDDNSDKIGREFVSELSAQFRDAILIRTHFQHWFSRAYNTAMRLVRTPHAVLLNSDTGVAEGWLDELYYVWDEGLKQTRMGLVGSVYDANLNIRWVFTRPGTPPGYVTGHAWLVSMEAFNDVANHRGTSGWYLDELNPLNIHIRSDVDMCLWLNKLGWGTAMSFKSHVGHVAGKSWGHKLHTIPSMLSEVEYKY